MSEQNAWAEELRVDGSTVGASTGDVSRAVKQRRIVIRNREEKTLIRLPMWLGLLIGISNPHLAAILAIAALLGYISIVVEREDENPQ